MMQAPKSRAEPEEPAAAASGGESLSSSTRGWVRGGACLPLQLRGASLLAVLGFS